MLKAQKFNDPKRLELFILEDIIKNFNLQNTQNLVEVGIGSGVIANIFLKNLPKLNCLGLDVDEEILTWTKQNRGDYEERLKLELLKDGKVFPIKDNFADLVTFAAVYHEVKEPS